MPECSRCGAWVDDKLLRVAGVPYGCPECAPWREIFGASTMPSGETVERYTERSLGTAPVLRWRMSDGPPEIDPPGSDAPPALPRAPIEHRRAAAVDDFLDAVGGGA